MKSLFTASLNTWGQREETDRVGWHGQAGMQSTTNRADKWVSDRLWAQGQSVKACWCLRWAGSTLRYSSNRVIHSYRPLIQAHWVEGRIRKKKSGHWREGVWNLLANKWKCSFMATGRSLLWRILAFDVSRGGGGVLLLNTSYVYMDTSHRNESSSSNKWIRRFWSNKTHSTR